ncbi:MAG: TRAP transporter substrate-binding protein DctP [Deferribacteraceae bacterium]|nr:TRAP transporter substrate-binding protein DctP [Deferribacteraceae bacterium]
MKLSMRMICVLVFSFALVFATACTKKTETPAAGGEATTAAEVEKIEVRFAGTEGAAAGQSRAMQEMADLLNASGRFNATVFPAGALSSDTDGMVTQAQMGMNLIIPSDPGRLASQFKINDLNILMAPYVLMDVALLDKLPETELYKTWQAQLEEQGVVLAADMFNGFRNFYTINPVEKLSDLAGLRIRGFGNDIGMALGKYLGFAQTTVAATEVYAGVQAKSLDGSESQASNADAYRLFEVSPYLAMTKHYMLQSSFVCGKAWLDTLSAEDRDFVLKTVYDVSSKYSKIIFEEEAGLFENFTKNGGTITNPDLAEFEAAIAPLYVNNDLGLSDGLKDKLMEQLGVTAAQ